ncbi:MAG: hypothetical protein H7293_21475 [Candidatus Saccharibacteria bacterium]|nr:hypothetical protein [Rhodoferax sp.]
MRKENQKNQLPTEWSCAGAGVFQQPVSNKIALQMDNFSKLQSIYPNQYSKAEMETNISYIRCVTGDSKKVYFVSNNDFY